MRQRERHKTLIRVLFLTLLGAAAGAATVTAQPIPVTPVKIVSDTLPKQLRHGAVGLKIGVLNTGKVTVKSDTLKPYEVDVDAAACGGVFFDVPIGWHLMISPAVDIYDVRALNVSQRFIDVSLGLKGVKYSPNSRIAVKPGAAVGFGYLADMKFVSSSSYLTVKWFCELMGFADSKYAWVFDVGWFWAPIGRVRQTHEKINVAPSLYLRVGLAL